MSSKMEKSLNRRNDIDWLRNLAILLLFPFHAARVFDYWEPNYVTNSELSWTLSWFIATTAYWFMPLLFFLAGASSWYALRVRENKAYVRERFTKLFIPLIIGIVVIVPPQGYFALKHHHNFNGTYLDSLVVFFTDYSDLSGYYGTFTPAHLWFILYLFVIALVFISMKSSLDKLINKGLLSSKWVLLSLFVPLTLTEALPSPAGKNLFYFLFIFIVGYLIGTDDKIREIINRVKFKLFMVLIPYVPLWFALAYFNQNAADFSPMSIFLAFIKNFALLLTLAVILGYGQKFLSVNNRILNYLNDAAFPLYILHQSVLIGISYYIVQLDMNILVKFSLITVVTFMISILLYEMIKRFTFTRWMFGMKLMKPQKIKQDHA